MAHKNRFLRVSSEETCFLFQVSLPPLGEALEVRAAHPQEPLEVLLGQMVLQTEGRLRLTPSGRRPQLHHKRGASITDSTGFCLPLELLSVSLPLFNFFAVFGLFVCHCSSLRRALGAHVIFTSCPLLCVFLFVSLVAFLSWFFSICG